MSAAGVQEVGYGKAAREEPALLAAVGRLEDGLHLLDERLGVFALCLEPVLGPSMEDSKPSDGAPHAIPMRVSERIGESAHLIDGLADRLSGLNIRLEI